MAGKQFALLALSIVIVYSLILQNYTSPVNNRLDKTTLFVYSDSDLSCNVPVAKAAKFSCSFVIQNVRKKWTLKTKYLR